MPWPNQVCQNHALHLGHHTCQSHSKNDSQQNYSRFNWLLTLDYVGINYIGCDLVIRAWNQKVYSLCDLRFEPCGCLYDGHWRLTWSLTSGPVGLVEVRVSWSGHLR